MSDWIDQLRGMTPWRDQGGISPVLDPLWPLLCDVVEAAEENLPLVDEYALADALERALAALRAEVEK